MAIEGPACCRAEGDDCWPSAGFHRRLVQLTLERFRTPSGRGSKTVRGIRRAWVKEQHVNVVNRRITEYQVNLLLTFVLED